MTAVPAVRRSSGDGPRPVDPRRDLAGLADLIEIAFAETLDASGRRMADEMRRFGRFGWLGWLLGHLFLPPAAFPLGFVWEEDRRLIGNASLLRVEGAPARWVLANVAVAPGFRRRGIARSLVEASLDLAESKQADEVVLQVKADNEAALELYRRFGFLLRCTRTSWRRARPEFPPLPSPSSRARLRRPEEWSEQYALARRLTPHGLVWPHPLRPGLFRPSVWPGADRWRHWVWPGEGRMQAWLAARIGAGEGQLFLVGEESVDRTAWTALLAAALNHPDVSPAHVVLETQGEASGDAARSFGFAVENRLAWMTRAGAADRRGPDAEPADD